MAKSDSARKPEEEVMSEAKPKTCGDHYPGARYSNCDEADLSFALSGAWQANHPKAAPKASEAPKVIPCPDCDHPAHGTALCDFCGWCKPAPAPEPKQGSEEQCECCGVAHTAESSDEEIESHFDRIFAFLAAKRRSEPIQMVLKSKYDALRAELAAAREEIAIANGQLSEAVEAAAIGEAVMDAVQGKPVSDFFESFGPVRDAQDMHDAINGLTANLAAEKARADRAEERVKELEAAIMDWDDQRRNIIRDRLRTAARAKEGEKR